MYNSSVIERDAKKYAIMRVERHEKKRKKQKFSKIAPCDRRAKLDELLFL